MSENTSNETSDSRTRWRRWIGLSGCLLVLLALPATWTLHTLRVSFDADKPYTAADMKNYDKVHPAALRALKKLREASGRRWTVTSAQRSRAQNRAEGGAVNSLHIPGKAFDLRVPHWAREDFYEYAKDAGFKGFGWGAGKVHVDIRPKRTWWSYDETSENVGGSKKWNYLYKAPANFIEELSSKRNGVEYSLRQRMGHGWKTFKWDLMMLCRDISLCDSKR